MSEPAPLTQLLHAWQGGDADAFSRLLGEVHGELMRMAGSRLRVADGSQTISRGDLLNEALLRVMQGRPNWQDRRHFFATVSTTMRNVLVDHARERQAAKRGGDFARVTWTLSAIGEEAMDADLLTLDQLLTRLKAEDERASEVLQLTYFGGLSRQDIAEVLGVSVPTVDRELRFARGWLEQQLDRSLEA
ncbi:MAG: sigma-70 family RNA polymerase sigma factor [Burkholderiales bacterium]|uniref:ECF-type sigma factor n=1 Tax=Inhella sp. TaxID=1921806 RepID=UPI001AD52A7C|nr:sigma-70 family RNA polymerase sigma factor [Burkholderiales bacterium]